MTRSRYFHFNKILKGPETSFQYPALSRKHFDITKDSKEISVSVTSTL